VRTLLGICAPDERIRGNGAIILRRGLQGARVGPLTDRKDVISKKRNEQHLFTRIEKFSESPSKAALRRGETYGNKGRLKLYLG
jgi:hypothetical protein